MYMADMLKAGDVIDLLPLKDNGKEITVKEFDDEEIIIIDGNGKENKLTEVGSAIEKLQKGTWRIVGRNLKYCSNDTLKEELKFAFKQLEEKSLDVYSYACNPILDVNDSSWDHQREELEEKSQTAGKLLTYMWDVSEELKSR